MNPLDDMSEIDESSVLGIADELERQLEQIHVNGSYLYNDSSLFADSHIDAIAPDTIEKQHQPPVDNNHTLETIHQLSRKSEIIGEQPKAVPPRAKIQNKSKPRPIKVERRNDTQKQLKRTASQKSVDPMRLVERSLEWAEDRKGKLLENQREKHRNETRQCSFRPRVNVNSNATKQFNNISNISSLSIVRPRKSVGEENVHITQNSSAQVNQGRPLIEKWKEQVQHQSELLKQKLEGNRQVLGLHRPQYNRISQPIRNIRANPITSNTNTQRSSSRSNTSRTEITKESEVQEYMRLMALSDSLFSELKSLKESNRLLATRLHPSKQLR